MDSGGLAVETGNTENQWRDTVRTTEQALMVDGTGAHEKVAARSQSLVRR